MEDDALRVQMYERKHGLWTYRVFRGESEIESGHAPDFAKAMTDVLRTMEEVRAARVGEYYATDRALEASE